MGANPLAEPSPVLATLCAGVAGQAIRELEVVAARIRQEVSNLHMDCPFCDGPMPPLSFMEIERCSCGATFTLIAMEDKDEAIRAHIETHAPMLSPGPSLKTAILSLEGDVRSPFTQSELGIVGTVPATMQKTMEMTAEVAGGTRH